MYLDYLTWHGPPVLSLTRPAHGDKMWRRAWVNGVDILDERGPAAFRLIQNAGRGLIIHGAREWTDYRVTADITPHMLKAGGIAARVQGMRRYYALWLAQPMDCLSLSQYLNDHIAGLVDKYPKNYVGLGTLPMQDTELAIKEAERCKKIGLKGIQIGSNINDDNLNEERFFPIFEVCEKLGLALLIHPWNMMGEKKMQKYWLPWLVGMPAETSRALCSMIFGGVFERLPKLRVNFAHAGGSFLFTIGRIEHGFDCRPDLVAIDNNINPRKYLGKFWVDSITHDALSLEYVIKLQGSRRITLGTDYPFPLGDLTVGKFIEEMDVSKKVKEDIFCNATLEWLNLSKKDFILNTKSAKRV